LPSRAFGYKRDYHGSVKHLCQACGWREADERSVEFNDHWHAIVLLLRAQTIIPLAMGERAPDK